MQEYFSVLKKSPLFAGVEERDMQALLNCLHARVRKTRREEILLSAGDEPVFVGVVLAGSVHIIQEDYWGNRTILAAVGAGGIFCEAFSCAQAEALPVSVVAHEDGCILLLNCQKIVTICPAACTFHAALVRNLIQVLANKNIVLTRKMEHITKKTTREKVMSYLSECALSAGTDRFEIPFNRQELADYLGVERSALSSTLGKLREEGKIVFHKNAFQIL